jgi:hypothetical protein
VGALLFGGWRLLHRAEPGDPQKIVISPDFVEGLREDATRRTGRAPSAAELRELVDRYADEEVMYREALRLGLDRGDIIVRRRLLEKIEFLTEDSSPLPEPTDAQLNAWLKDHADDYLDPERVTFRHVFVRREHRANAEAILGQLRAGAAPESLGDPFVSGAVWTRRSKQQITASFGDAFAERLWNFPTGASWAGPIESTYGLHLVQLQELAPPRHPTLDEVRPKVQKAWLDFRRREVDREAVRRLRQGYRVELPPLLEGPVASVGARP